MDEKNTFPEKPIGIYVIKGVCMGVLTLVLKLIVTGICRIIYRDGDSVFGALEPFAVHILCFVGTLFVANSIFCLLLNYDKTSSEEFFLREGEDISEFSKKFMYKSFFAEAASATAVLSLAALVGASPEIAGMFYFQKEGRSPYSAGIVPMLATVFVMTLVFLNSRNESVRYWRYLKKRLMLDELENKRKMLFRICFIVLVYPITIPFFPFIAYAVYTLVSIAIELCDVMTVPGFIGMLVGIFALSRLIRFLRARRARKKFFRNLSEVVTSSKYKISEIKNPYRSLVSVKKQCTFTLEYDDEKFTCLVVTSPRFRVPICFESDAEAFFRYRLGTPRHNITLRRGFSYAFDGEGVKIIIVTPTPKDVLICDEDKERRLFNADKLWDFVIYDADAFIGSADRKCLGRGERFKR